MMKIIDRREVGIVSMIVWSFCRRDTKVKVYKNYINHILNSFEFEEFLKWLTSSHVESPSEFPAGLQYLRRMGLKYKSITIWSFCKIIGLKEFGNKVCFKIDSKYEEIQDLHDDLISGNYEKVFGGSRIWTDENREILAKQDELIKILLKYIKIREIDFDVSIPNLHRIDDDSAWS